ncbi:hypothetical protein [Dactylosporangium sp. CS-033363]|uniref:hypothetical protein n=1 Tax=Dactylosporangium sp. CS-033363 TaxID=3239935 RepID=UPI003D8CEA7F
MGTLTRLRLPRTACTAAQVAAALGWAPDRFDDARRLQLVPGPDVTRPAALGPRWSPAAVRDLAARRDALGRDVDMGALGASRSADELAARLGVDVDAHTVLELSRLGYLPRGGSYKGNRLYAGWALARFADLEALAQAAVSGQLHTTDEVVSVLGVRRSDVEQLVQLRWLRPARMVDNPMQSRRRGAGTVPLYRRGDVLGLLVWERVDWAAVRAVPAGRRSLLAGLGECDVAAAAELRRVADGLLYHQLGHRKWAAGDVAAAAACWRAAAGHAVAGEHLAAVDGEPAAIDRCAAWMALLPARERDLV